ncbi:E-selectin isoform X5 [Esox lucius]|uniref:E-selectin isoform X5 n=1 Tax=Esox lucius TaxID=8010 RepID=UPI0014770DA4|nr:E-selectin isoform X5 [Esox lucius]
MQLITLCFVFVLSLCTFNVVKCQDCSRENFISQFSAEKLDLSKLENTDSGKTVRLSCTVGYVGLSRYTCKNGEWKKQSGRPCERKSCGHPGDTPNGDFHLTFSDDFVFGAQVEYQCKTGYQMVSRTKHRTCMEQGWDNAIPICEAVKCPVIQANKNVLVIGDSEDATFGNVIQFECQSNQMVLKGPTEIDCNDRGDWSGTVPTCEEIKCYVPNIVHGFVTGSQEEFKENDILRYGCSKYYTPFSRSSRCTKIGNKATWSPPPECEAVKCPVIQADKNVLVIGDSEDATFGNVIQFECQSNQMFLKGPTEIDCNDRGEWSGIVPTCEAVKCPVIQADKNVLVIGDSEDATFGNVIQFECQSNQMFLKGPTEIDCNDRGEWSGIVPTCEEIKCYVPNIVHGFVTGSQEEFKENDILRYGCSKNYTPFSRSSRCTKIGNKATWSPPPECEERTCAPPDDTLVKYGRWERRWRTGRFEEKKYYQCIFGYKPTNGATFAECTNDGTWTPNPLCQKITCAAPHDNLVSHTSLTRWRTGKLNDQNYYQCKPGYKPTKDATFAKCTIDGTWTPNPLCEASCPDPPTIENGEAVPKLVDKDGIAIVVSYTCPKSYTLTSPK